MKDFTSVVARSGLRHRRFYLESTVDVFINDFLIPGFHSAALGFAFAPADEEEPWRHYLAEARHRVADDPPAAALMAAIPVRETSDADQIFRRAVFFQEVNRPGYLEDVLARLPYRLETEEGKAGKRYYDDGIAQFLSDEYDAHIALGEEIHRIARAWQQDRGLEGLATTPATMRAHALVALGREAGVQVEAKQDGVLVHVPEIREVRLLAAGSVIYPESTTLRWQGAAAETDTTVVGATVSVHADAGATFRCTAVGGTTIADRDIAPGASQDFTAADLNGRIWQVDVAPPPDDSS